MKSKNEDSHDGVKFVNMPPMALPEDFIPWNKIKLPRIKKSDIKRFTKFSATTVEFMTTPYKPELKVDNKPLKT